MPALPSELYNHCRAILLRCSELGSDASLRAVFTTNELRQFRDRVPPAENTSDRVAKCLDYLLDQQLSDGRPVLPVFLTAMRDKYSEGDALHDELASLCPKVTRSLSGANISEVTITPVLKSDSELILGSEGTCAFENREQDLQEIFSTLESEPYLHLYAPSGVGKTYLAKQLLQVYYTQHRKAYFDFSDPKFQSQSRSTESMLQEIYDQFHPNVQPQPSGLAELLVSLALKVKENSRYGVVILDNVDRIASSVMYQLREETLPALQSKIADPTLYLRFVAIAQVEIEELGGVGRVSFQPRPLEEFQGILPELKTYKNLLRQAAQRWGGRQLDPQDAQANDLLRDWATALYNLTGGHPGAIQETLNHVGRYTQFARAKIFEEQREAICRQVLAPLVEQQVQISLPRLPEHQRAFRLLWIFRYLSKGVFRQVLREVKDKPYWRDLNAVTREVDYGAEHAPLWGRWADTSLMQHKGTRRLLSHRITPIWRKIGNLVLQVTTPMLYPTLHGDARRVFDYFALGEHEYDISMRIDCFVEAIYHLTQEASGVLSERSRNDFTHSILERLDNFLSLLKDKKLFDEYLYNLNDLLESDQELQVELNLVGRPDTWQQLANAIKRHMQ